MVEANSGEGQGIGGGSVLETLLSLILSEKAGINIREDTASSKPLEEFIRQFSGRKNGDPLSKDRPASTEKADAGFSLNLLEVSESSRIRPLPGASGLEQYRVVFATHLYESFKVARRS